MQRTKGLQTEKKQNNLFRTIIWKNMRYNRNGEYVTEIHDFESGADRD